MSALRLSPHVATLLCRFVEEHTGIHYGEEILDLFVEKLSRRLALSGHESALDYYYFLRYDPGGRVELDALIDTLVVGETYLFREVDQLEVLCDQILAPAVARGERPRVWSAACATGEEPLTLAMLLDRRGLTGRVDLVASDISNAALDRARRGDLSRRAVRSTFPETYRHWLRTDTSGATHARPELVDTITFRRVNLAEPAEVKALGAFDAVICRNVLIYFSDATTRSVVTSLHDALVPGGFLLVGASESLLRLGTMLTCEERGGVFFYRKEVGS
ncbi:CheR family methyltransferase [Chondromyces apiculatus]|uniref:protein-glutamate O-methyltransferase n=1 Tax=Chondromyces apiculatus DSM 436 TaxID=1192034 RepID=A0A017T419_9BACT|nr:protein-glutamate O-methyltransferase CheR [Chondromyces apiculatus]EYF03994.1 Chemotaxis protein methyltransferase CheR [Chondromyces apiculatus DSM 436]